MKRLVITQAEKLPFGIESKIAILPQTFAIHTIVDPKGRITIIFLEDNCEKEEIHNIVLSPPEGYIPFFEKLTNDQLEYFGIFLNINIAFDLSYFAANDKYYFADEYECVANQPGVFDVNVKAEEWYKDLMFEVIAATELPSKKENKPTESEQTNTSK